jgi:hypothetical protein
VESNSLTDKLTIWTAINAERAYQDIKYGSEPHTIGGWLLLIEDELKEAKHALIKGGVGRDSVRQEIIQVAALCLAALEQHGIHDSDLGRKEL